AEADDQDLGPGDFFLGSFTLDRCVHVLALSVAIRLADHCRVFKCSPRKRRNPTSRRRLGWRGPCARDFCRSLYSARNPTPRGTMLGYARNEIFGKNRGAGAALTNPTYELRALRGRPPFAPLRRAAAAFAADVARPARAARWRSM